MWVQVNTAEHSDWLTFVSFLSKVSSTGSVVLTACYCRKRPRSLRSTPITFVGNLKTFAMTTLNFSVNINAPKEVVWNKLWNDESYRYWTSVFMEGSYAESDWQEGSKVRFLTPTGEGMYSVIEKLEPYRQMTFKHLGELKEGKEEPKDWGGARESYELAETNGSTQLTVRLDTTENHQAYFADVFPKALEKVRELSEQ
jgi:hypothetical protein